MTDMYDKLRQLKVKQPVARKKFSELPDMKVEDNRFVGFDLDGLVKTGLEGIRENFIEQGEKAPEMKIVGITLHVLMLKPDCEENNEMVALTDVVAWHKDVGDVQNLLTNYQTMEQKCDSNCNHNSEEQPYKANKYEGAMYG